MSGLSGQAPAVWVLVVAGALVSAQPRYTEEYGIDPGSRERRSIELTNIQGLQDDSTSQLLRLAKRTSTPTLLLPKRPDLLRLAKRASVLRLVKRGDILPLVQRGGAASLRLAKRGAALRLAKRGRTLIPNKRGFLRLVKRPELLRLSKRSSENEAEYDDEEDEEFGPILEKRSEFLRLAKRASALRLAKRGMLRLTRNGENVENDLQKRGILRLSKRGQKQQQLSYNEALKRATILRLVKRGVQVPAVSWDGELQDIEDGEGGVFVDPEAEDEGDDYWDHLHNSPIWFEDSQHREIYDEAADSPSHLRLSNLDGINNNDYWEGSVWEDPEQLEHQEQLQQLLEQEELKQQEQLEQQQQFEQEKQFKEQQKQIDQVEEQEQVRDIAPTVSGLPVAEAKHWQEKYKRKIKPTRQSIRLSKRGVQRPIQMLKLSKKSSDEIVSQDNTPTAN